MSKPLKIDFLDLPGEDFFPDLAQNITENVTKALKLIDRAKLRQLSSASGALKRSLMSFDKLNRLNAPSGKSKRPVSIWELFKDFIDLGYGTKLQSAFKNLGGWMDNLSVEVLQEDRAIAQLQKTLERLGLTMQRSTEPAKDFLLGMVGYPVAVEKAKEALGRLDPQFVLVTGLLERLNLVSRDASKGLLESFSGLGEFFQKRVSDPIRMGVENLFGGMPTGADSAWSETKRVFSDAATYFSTTFQKAWDGVLRVFSDTEPTFSGVVGSVVGSMKSVVNRLISGINAAIVEPFSGINNAFSKLKSFTVNGVQPFKNLNFSVSMPSIPLLAAGAVLPANKPFLAMVGDQKHGTNIEAPLATIEQAVANVMGGVVEAEMAGHNATVSLLRQILEAVLGISLDENALGRAVQQYNLRQMVMTGGF